MANMDFDRISDLNLVMLQTEEGREIQSYSLGIDRQPQFTCAGQGLDNTADPPPLPRSYSLAT